jgi:hypothetical protein
MSEDVLVAAAFGLTYAAVFTTIGAATRGSRISRRTAYGALAVATLVAAVIADSGPFGIVIGAGLTAPAVIYIWIGSGLRDADRRALAAVAAVLTLPVLAVVETVAWVVLFLTQCDGCLS